MGRGRIKASVVVLAAMAVLTLTVGTGDVWYVHAAYEQWRTSWYLEAPGVILSTDIHHWTKGIVSVQMTYCYTVGDHCYQGDQYRKLMSFENSRIVSDQYDNASELVVYYDPASPGDSVVQNDLQWPGLFFAGFLVPLSILLAPLWRRVVLPAAG